MLSWSSQRKEFVRICQRALLAQMQISNGGNLSMRLQENVFLVKPSGVALSEIKETDLLVSDVSGAVVEGRGKPTKEIQTHLAIYGVRPDVGGIVHYHSPFATTYAVSKLEIPMKTVHSKRILGRIPTVPSNNEGTEVLAQSVKCVFEDLKVFAALLFDHGILAVGTRLTDAQNIAELVEETARIAYLSHTLAPVSTY